MDDGKLRLEYIDAEQLADNPANWRRHGDAQRSALEGVLAEVGWAGALLYNEKTKRLIDGHLRKKVSKGPVPVLVGSWTEEQERTILATLDPIAAMANADKEKLAELLRLVETEDDGVKRMIDDLAKQEKIELAMDDDGEAPEPQIDKAAELQKKWGTCDGQLWVIPGKAGEHRLLCGDATSEEDMVRLMAGKLAVLYTTDPPYLVDYTGADRPNKSGKDWSDSYREIDIKDAYTFFRGTFSVALRYLADNAAWYCWHAHKRAAEIEKVWSELGILNHMQIIWVKPSAMHTYSFYPWQHEPCLMGWKQGHKPLHDGDNSHAITSVWEYGWNGKARIVGNMHPTQKPIELFAIPIRKHTKMGDICLETFNGSGTQMVAAEQLGRLCYGIEIAPPYVAVALQRMADMGLKPQLAK